jgi:hypothetical protein
MLCVLLESSRCAHISEYYSQGIGSWHYAIFYSLGIYLGNLKIMEMRMKDDWNIYIPKTLAVPNNARLKESWPSLEKQTSILNNSDVHA